MSEMESIWTWYREYQALLIIIEHLPDLMVSNYSNSQVHM